MNDEILLLPEETTDPTGEPTTPATEIPYFSPDDWPVIETEEMGDESDATYWEDLYEDGSDENSLVYSQETGEPVTVQIIEAVDSDIVHASLFGSFLICGTLVGLAILRNIHGT